MQYGKNQLSAELARQRREGKTMGRRHEEQDLLTVAGVRAVNPTVREMVSNHLSAHGFEGLVENCGDCACDLSDLMPCDSDVIGGCEAGWKVACNPETCPLEGECDWHITIHKPEKPFVSCNRNEVE